MGDAVHQKVNVEFQAEVELGSRPVAELVSEAGAGVVAGAAAQQHSGRGEAGREKGNKWWH
jgi:hypothetical protein